MKIERIRNDVTPVREALASMHEQAAEISGMVVLVCKNGDENYDYFIAGTVGAERAIGRLEIIKQALLNKIRF